MRAAGAIAAASLLALVVAGAALAHGTRTVGDVTLVVGFIGEPVAAGQRSGLELEVTRKKKPVVGLERTLLAEVTYGSSRLDLPISPRSSGPGWYESVFTPTAAGQYTFHVSGSIEGTPIDERFTSGVDGFEDVAEADTRQFPVQLPPAAVVTDDARRGADAARLLPLAMLLAGVGAVSGLLALGVALGSRRRRE